jgi:hypothetical protein
MLWQFFEPVPLMFIDSGYSLCLFIDCVCEGYKVSVNLKLIQCFHFSLFGTVTENGMDAPAF